MIDAKVFDGEYEIIYSRNFNIYENELLIDSIRGFKFKFIFERNTQEVQTSGFPIMFSSDSTDNKKMIVTLRNFRNTFGVGMNGKSHVLDLADGKKIFVSVYAKSLDASKSDFLNVSVTFYLK